MSSSSISIFQATAPGRRHPIPGSYPWRFTTRVPMSSPFRPLRLMTNPDEPSSLAMNSETPSTGTSATSAARRPVSASIFPRRFQTTPLQSHALAMKPCSACRVRLGQPRRNSSTQSRISNGQETLRTERLCDRVKPAFASIWNAHGTRRGTENCWGLSLQNRRTIRRTRRTAFRLRTGAAIHVENRSCIRHASTCKFPAGRRYRPGTDPG